VDAWLLPGIATSALNAFNGYSRWLPTATTLAAFQGIR
jgi:hypothetical protein